MINIDENDKQVQLLGLRSKHLIDASKICQHLRAIYKFGTGSGGDPCPLCEFAARISCEDAVLQALNDLLMNKHPSQCEVCPWVILEDQTCCGWFRDWYLAWFGESCIDAVYQMIKMQRAKDPRFLLARIKMLDWWVRRLNALAKRAEKRERSSK